MNVLVLIGGAIDPKLPLTAAQLQPKAIQDEPTGTPALARKLSPFDESALECALKLRDADPATRIAALLAGADVPLALLRHLASFRLDDVRGLQLDPGLAWDTGTLVAELARAVTAYKPDLVLMGRQFGDFDDGALAPVLAETLGWRYVALSQQVTVESDRLVFVRERDQAEERLRAATPVLAGITNDRRNRLRYPLMKNIAAARKQSFENEQSEALPSRVRLDALQDTVPLRQGEPCRMLEGDVQAQAAALAALLREGA